MFVSILLVTISASIVLATVIHVPTDAATIQAGIDAANNSDTVLVAPGTYTENINFNGKDIVLVSVAGPESTIIDADLQGCAVKILRGETENAVLDGFTLTNGNGMLLDDLNVYAGGGINVRFGSNPILRNLIIFGNFATTGEDPAGGGIAIGLQANPHLENVIIRGNSSKWGGGLSIREASPTFSNVRIYENHATTTGGGVYIGVESYPVFEEVYIFANNANYYGGGIFIHEYSAPLFNRVTITQNISPSGGGGIIVNHGSTPYVTNSICWGNIPNQLMMHNDPIFDPSELIVAYSNIEGGQDGIGLGIGELFWLDGNINTDPLFNDAGNHDFKLLNDSPCIDTGSSLITHNFEILVDLGPDEYIGTNPDMGAHEFNPAPLSQDNASAKPMTFILHQNYPNPFNPTTTIKYQLPELSEVLLTVFDIQGQIIQTLFNEAQLAGQHQIVWNGLDHTGKQINTGVNFSHLKAGAYSKTIKMLLLK